MLHQFRHKILRAEDRWCRGKRRAVPSAGIWEPREGGMSLAGEHTQREEGRVKMTDVLSLGE